MSEESPKATPNQEFSDELRIRELLPVLLKSRWAVWIVVAVSFLLALLSGILFAYQVQAESHYDYLLYREEKGAWIHLLGHLVRAFVGLWLGMRLLRYLRQLQRLKDRTDLKFEPLFDSISRAIASVGWSCLAMFCVGLLFFADVTYGLPSLPVRSRSSQMRFSPVEDPTVKVMLCEAEFTATEGWTESSFAVKRTVHEPVYLKKEAILETEDIAEAKATVDANGSPALSLRLTEAGSKKLAAATANLIDKPVAFVIDDVVLTVPIVRSPLSESLLLTGDFTEERVQEIANSINGSTSKE